MTDPTAAELRDALCEMLENLEGYIQREGQKAAAPLIEQAQQEANAAIREAEAEVQRRDDVLKELRRRLAVLDVAQGNLTAVRRRLGELLGRGERWPGALESLLDEVEERFAELDRFRATADHDRRTAQKVNAGFEAEMDVARRAARAEVGQ